MLGAYATLWLKLSLAAEAGVLFCLANTWWITKVGLR